MNKGTRLRLLALFVTITNEVLVSIGTIDFGDHTVNVVYKVISVLFMIGAAVAAYWYNNDWTEDACIGTGITRQRKAEKRADYVGERFYFDENGEPIEAEFPEDCVEIEEEGETYES